MVGGTIGLADGGGGGIEGGREGGALGAIPVPDAFVGGWGGGGLCWGGGGLGAAGSMLVADPADDGPRTDCGRNGLLYK